MKEKSENKEKVLVVDDEEDFLNLMLLHLKKKGYQVTGATDPQEALKILEEQAGEFAVLVTDWMMPNMSGNSLIHNARKIDPLMQAIIITSVLAMGSNRKLGFSAFEYLDKPLKSMNQLSETVERAIAFRDNRILSSSSKNTATKSNDNIDHEANTQS